MQKSINEKRTACLAYFEQLAEILKDTHVVVKSCNGDMSSYLVPIGTETQISYYGKPGNSYRVSDHWNWFSNTEKCRRPGYVQCFCADMPFARRRTAKNKASKPRYAFAVAYFGDDNKYHHVFGEKFDFQTHSWEWVENN